MRNRKLKPSPLVVARAHAFRSDMTWSEMALWRLINAGQLGVWFKRQVPLPGNFVADFLAPAARLIVEVDGGWHRDRVRADERRDRKLRRLGYRVLRIDAELVVRDPEATVQLVRTALGATP